MAKLAATYEDKEFVQQAVAQIPWSHNTTILDKVKTPEQREWYIRKQLPSIEDIQKHMASE